jgi:glycerol-3-phosphate dehydrogenase (NAD(P)+)
MSQKIQRVGVIGAGAWGAALAIACQRAGRDVTLWAREPEVVASIHATHENSLFLPGVKIPESVVATGDMAEAARGDAILVVTPAQHTRSALAALAPHVPAGTPVILCAKGIERGSLSLMTEALSETLPNATAAVLSGPSFAKEVAIGLPTAVTLACADRTTGDQIVQAISSSTFRLYYSNDLIGAEIGGSVKNVLAIACGIADGLGLGDSARAALITRGFAELTRLGEALGGKRETLTGLCGLGDLILTCSSAQSRNFSLGRALASGKSAAEALNDKRSVAEGAETAPALMALAKKSGVEMPICETVLAILEGRITSQDAVIALLSRPPRDEISR